MKKRILIVEDTRALAENMADLFRMEGYYVDVSENGLAGLRRIRQSNYDLIISDLIMPVMDGEAFVREIQAEAAHIPVIVLTARHLDEVQLDSLRSHGVDLILNKTVEIDVLLNFVSQLASKINE